LKDITAASGQVNFHDQNNTIKLTDAQAGIHYNANGTLSGINGSSGQLDWQSASGDHLNVQNLSGEVKYDGNGQLQSVSAAAGNVNYSGSFGQIKTEGQTKLELSYGDGGKLKSAAASTDKLSYSGDQGQIDLSKGQINLQYDSN